MHLSQIGVKLWVEFNWLRLRHMRKYIREISKFCRIFMVQVYGKGNTVPVGCFVSEICMSIIFSVNLQTAVSRT